jgi:hypothetical protein
MLLRETIHSIHSSLTMGGDRAGGTTQGAAESDESRQLRKRERESERELIIRAAHLQLALASLDDPKVFAD